MAEDAESGLSDAEARSRIEKALGIPMDYDRAVARPAAREAALDDGALDGFSISKSFDGSLDLDDIRDAAEMMARNTHSKVWRNHVYARSPAVSGGSGSGWRRGSLAADSTRGGFLDAGREAVASVALRHTERMARCRLCGTYHPEEVAYPGSEPPHATETDCSREHGGCGESAVHDLLDLSGTVARWRGECPHCGYATEMFAGDTPLGETVRCPECVDWHRDAPLEWFDGLSSTKADRLRVMGYETVGDVADASQAELADVGAVGNALAARLKAQTQTLAKKAPPLAVAGVTWVWS